MEKDDYGKTVSREDYEYNTNFYFPSIINGMVHDEVSHYKKGTLELPASVTAIEFGAFMGCDNLRYVLAGSRSAPERQKW